MPDASSSYSEVEPQSASVPNANDGVDVTAQQVTISGNVAGRDIIGYTVEQVSSLLAQIGTTLQPKPFDGRCSYLGLDAFSEDDADRCDPNDTAIILDKFSNWEFHITSLLSRHIFHKLA